MDHLRNSESTEQAAKAVELPEKPSKESVREPSEQKAECEPCAAPVPSDPSQSDRTQASQDLLYGPTAMPVSPAKVPTHLTVFGNSEFQALTKYSIEVK